MFLKFRYRLGYESLCREVSDSISWRVFCRIPLDAVPHPTTLIKITTRCGARAVAGLNEALLAKAARRRCCAPAGSASTPPWCRRSGLSDRFGAAGQGGRRIAATGERIQAAGGAIRTSICDRSRARASERTDRSEAAAARRAGAGPGAGHGVRVTGELAELAATAPTRPNGCSATPSKRCAARGPKPTSCGNAVCTTGRRASPRAAGPRDQRPGRTVAATRQIVAQARQRVAGMPRWGQPAGQPARCRCPPDRQRAPGETGRIRAQGPDRRQRRRGRPRSQCRAGIRPTRRNWRPR